MSTTTKFEGPFIRIISKLNGGKEGNLFLANEAKRLMNPYVPAKNLVLSQNIRVTADTKRGYVTYNSPYAHYQYEGILYVDPVYGKGAFKDAEGRFWSRPNVAKVPTDRNLKHSSFRHPLATSHWDKAMMVARGPELAEAYQRWLTQRKT